MQFVNILCTVYCLRVNSESTNRCLFGKFIAVNFLVHSRYEFREILTVERVISRLLNESRS